MVPAGLCAYRDLRRKRARKWGDTVTQPDDPRRVGVIVELIDHTIAIAKLNERGDLVQRLTRARQRITDPQVRVVIAGLLKQGKSQLLNSLLNLPAARVGDDEATVVITVVSYSAQPSARLVLAAGPDGTTAAVDIPVDDISTDVRRAPHAGGREVLRVEVGAPSPLLRGGLAFIDTPGVGGLGQPHLSATLGLLPEADAVLVVSDTSQEFTEPEMWFVRQAHQICPVGAVVATKTDLYPRWREIVNANAAHLQRARVPMPIIAVSSLLRSHAVTLNDKELNEESNFPAIVKFLSEQVLSRATERVRAGVLGEIRSATEQLAVSLGSELSVVNDPNLRDRLASDLERRKREAQQPVQQTALWQQVLGDGFNDLTADVDHDLRTRFRTVTEDAERQIDSCDPTAHWAEIGNDVENAIATAVGDNFVWAYQRSEALADDVARSFADAGLDSVLSAELSPHVMGTDFGRLKALGRMESKPLRRGHKMIIGMRGSYGGVVMIGMLSSVVGLGLFNPLSVGAGLILGRMAYKEDKQNRLLRVRSEAKANVRRFVDDISFVVSKQSRDRLKMIQRLLRDHYREIAEEITRSLTESLQATIAAAQVAETERDNRIRELQRQLGILSQVNDNLAGLEPTLTPRASLGRA
ncbi:isoniazid inductible gene protein INIA [Mycobacterium tuberculosis]|nr:isoniazid inductible gene protein INIA [Mycobacterium tuberculosis]